MLNGVLYESAYEAQFHMLFDKNKQFVHCGDAWPENVSLEKGDYDLHLQIRHDSVSLLEKRKTMMVFLEKPLGSDIALSFYPTMAAAVTGGSAYSKSKLARGKVAMVFAGATPDDKLPKGASPGDMLVGKWWCEKGNDDIAGPKQMPKGFRVRYVIPAKASKIDKKDKSAASEAKGSSTADQKDATAAEPKASEYGDEKLSEMLKDCKISRLRALQGKKDVFDRLHEALSAEYPGELGVLQAKLNHVDSKDIRKDAIDAVVVAADAILTSNLIDAAALANHYATKVDSKLDPSYADRKKDMDAKKAVLVEALVRKMRAQLDLKDVAFKDTYLELAKWEDVSSDKYAYLSFQRAMELERYGQALQILSKLCKASLASGSVGVACTGTPSPKELFELRISLLEKLQWDKWVEMEKRWNIIRFPNDFALF